MDRSLRTIAVLGPLALLGACLQVAPRSSVPFQAAADRQTRYAAEITLAVKEDRRGEVSEAAANGRMVLPQLPEIWGPPRAGPDRPHAALEPDLGQLEPVAVNGLLSVGCASLGGPSPDAASPAGCRPGWRAGTLDLPPSGYASIAPAAAPFDP